MASLLQMGAVRLMARKRGSFAALSTALAVLKVVRKLSGDGPKTLFTHELRPGDVLVVSEPAPPTEQGRRAKKSKSRT